MSKISLEQNTFDAFERILACIGYERGNIFDYLADLIEPEPERTCKVTEYNDCGPHAEDCTIVFSCGHETLGYIPNYCPSCGAKVVK